MGLTPLIDLELCNVFHGSDFVFQRFFLLGISVPRL